MADWLTTEQAHELSGYTRSYIGELVKEGKLVGRRDEPADERSERGLHLWVLTESLMAYIDERGRSTPPPPLDTSQEGDIRCPWCLRGCASQEDLDLHMRIVHPRLAESYEPVKDVVKRGKLSTVMVIE